MSKATALANFAAANAAGSSFGFKNRIINGDMRIDQRNAGAALTASSANNGFNFIDRWRTFISGAGTFSIQRSTDAPPGFSHSTLFTVVNSVSPAAADVYVFIQPIEGSNVADFAFGSASAATVTISFWVKSSVTGVYCVLLGNFNNRTYVANYTVNAANTWEYKTVTIPGDTTGTWPTDTSAGMSVTFDFGSGSNANVSPNTWLSSGRRTSNAVNWVANAGATFRVTGVQLEKGPTATAFDFRSIGQELTLCQRYYEKSYTESVVPGASVTQGLRVANMGSPTVGNSTGFFVGSIFCVTKRASPTVTVYSFQGTAGRLSTGAGLGTQLAAGSGTASAVSQNSFAIDNQSGGTVTITDYSLAYHFVASAEL